MKNTIFSLFIIGVFFLSGCSTTLFKENFDSYSGPVEVYPSGPPDDIVKIVPIGADSPMVDNNHKLMFTSPLGQARLITDNYNDPESKKTIYWEGDVALGDGPIWFVVSAGNSSGEIGFAPHLRIKIWKTEVKLESYISPSSGFQQIQGPALISGIHHIFISLNPKSNSYYVSISSSSASQKEWTGSLQPGFVNHLKNNPRIIMHVLYPTEATPAKYYMDNIIMRDKG